MSSRKKVDDYGIHIGKLPKGKLNKISDVDGVAVGHCTIDTEEHKTGVTVVMPLADFASREKRIAACHILNGYGKTLGLVQVEELGTVETPIALTNTLNVGLVHDALVEYMIQESRKAGVDLRSVNPVVCECNDGYLSHIVKRAIGQNHVFEAIQNACVDFEEGDIGAGKGLSCYQLKGGIGSASRVVELDGRDGTIGVVVQTNHGILEDLTIEGRRIGEEIARKRKGGGQPAGARSSNDGLDKGSVIVILATDVPCSSRQLKRICKRASVGLARTGSYIGHGSGEIVIGFSTANRLKSDESRDIVPVRILNEERMDLLFRAVAEATEEAVLNSMIAADRVAGYGGHVRESLREYL